MASINLVTGYTGEAHITSEDDALLNAFLAGQDNSAINLDGDFNDTDCDISCDALIGGRLVRTDGLVNLTFTKPASGYYRYDGVYIVYTKATSGIESAELVYCEGTENAVRSTAESAMGTPSTPSPAPADMQYMLLYTVAWDNAQTKTVTANIVEGGKIDTITNTIDAITFADGETGSGTCFCVGKVLDTWGEYALTLPLPKMLKNGQTFNITGGDYTIFSRDGTTTSRRIDADETTITGTRPAWVNIREAITSSGGYTTGLCMVQYNYEYVITR